MPIASLIVACVVTAGDTGGPTPIPTCGDEFAIVLTGSPLPPFIGEILGVGLIEGTIVNTRVDVTFTTSGEFDAADLSIAFNMPIDGVGAAVSFSGAELGWSGSGTFSASFESALLNGDIAVQPGSSWYSWFAWVTNLDAGAGPITGTLNELTYTLEFAECPPGDLDGDIAVGITDFLLLLDAWGSCVAPTDICKGDLNGDLDIDVADLLILLGNWGDHW